MVYALYAAGAYNMLWGAWVVFFPASHWQVLGMAPPRYMALWQCIGMIVGVYGLGYAIAARDPVRHWPIIFVGLVGKVLGPAGLGWAVLTGQLPLRWGVINVFNDAIWWVPFALALRFAWAEQRKARIAAATSEPGLPLPAAAAALKDQNGDTLVSLSMRTPTLVIFLRHPG